MSALRIEPTISSFDTSSRSGKLACSRVPISPTGVVHFGKWAAMASWMTGETRKSWISSSHGVPSASTAAFTASRQPWSRSHMTKEARSYRSGRPTDRNTMDRMPRRTLRADAPKVPAAACSPADCLPRVVSSRSASLISVVRCESPRGCVPSAKGSSVHKARSTFTKCDLPLPKKPLTQMPGCSVLPRFARYVSSTFRKPASYWPWQTKVDSS